jgi:hypothetical protein
MPVLNSEKDGKMNSKILVMGIVCAALGVGAVGCGKRSKSSSGDDFGTALGNALVLGMAKDQYTKAKAKYDAGQDASDECFMDTSELKKDKSDEAQTLAKQLDQLCEVDVPSRKLGKDLDDKMTSVTTDRTDKKHADELPSDQVMLKFTCDEATERLTKITTLGLAASANAVSLQSKHDADCTKDNLEGGPIKQARRK